MRPGPECAQARVTLAPLLPTRWQDLDGTVSLLLEGLGELEGETTPELAAAQHIGGCAACQAWLDMDGRYPERAARRERLAHYCCGDMFGAVIDAAYPVQFSCATDRDSKLHWLINRQSAAQFCPWCGVKLPAAPFEEAAADERL